MNRVLSNCSPVELIALATGRKGASAMADACRVVEKVGLKKLPDAGAAEIQAVCKGMTKAAVEQLMAGVEIGLRISELQGEYDKTERITGPGMAIRFCLQRFGRLDALKSRLAKALDEGFEPEQVPIVFPNILGGYMRGSNFHRNVWHPIRDEVGIPDTFVFHDLRHTQASLLLAAGVDLKVIQKRLGHRDFATPANTYSHLLQGAQNDAVKKMSALMKKSAPKPEKK